MGKKINMTTERWICRYTIDDKYPDLKNMVIEFGSGKELKVSLTKENYKTVIDKMTDQVEEFEEKIDNRKKREKVGSRFSIFALVTGTAFIVLALLKYDKIFYITGGVNLALSAGLGASFVRYKSAINQGKKYQYFIKNEKLFSQLDFTDEFILKGVSKKGIDIIENHPREFANEPFKFNMNNIENIPFGDLETILVNRQVLNGFNLSAEGKVDSLQKKKR